MISVTSGDVEDDVVDSESRESITKDASLVTPIGYLRVDNVIGNLVAAFVCVLTKID